MDWLVISNIALWVFLILQLIAYIMLTKLVVKFLNRFRVSGGQAQLMQIRPGMSAPFFRVKDQDGKWINLSENQGQFTMLIFRSDTCGSCHEVVSNLPKLQAVGLHMRYILVGKQESEKREENLPPNTYFVRSNEIFSNYYIDKVPTVTIIDPGGTVAMNTVVTSFDELHSSLMMLIRQAS